MSKRPITLSVRKPSRMLTPLLVSSTSLVKLTMATSEPYGPRVGRRHPASVAHTSRAADSGSRQVLRRGGSVTT